MSGNALFPGGTFFTKECLSQEQYDQLHWNFVWCFIMPRRISKQIINSFLRWSQNYEHLQNIFEILKIITTWPYLFIKLKGAYNSSDLSDTIFNKMWPQMGDSDAESNQNIVKIAKHQGRKSVSGYMSKYIFFSFSCRYCELYPRIFKSHYKTLWISKILPFYVL